MSGNYKAYDYDDKKSFNRSNASKNKNLSYEDLRNYLWS
jgi:hypothetical protein